MEIALDPSHFKLWAFSERRSFEHGDEKELAGDIIKNGQLKPVIARPIKQEGSSIKYEIISGSRRWQACLKTNLSLLTILKDLTDFEAMQIQRDENRKLGVCDYSKGLLFSEYLKKKVFSRSEIKDVWKISDRTLSRFLCFEKMPLALTEAIGNLSNLTPRTGEFLYRACEGLLNEKGGMNEKRCENSAKTFLKGLIDLAPEIKEGVGESKLRELLGLTNPILILSKSGQRLGEWLKDDCVKINTFLLDARSFENHLQEFFNKNQGEAI